MAKQKPSDHPPLPLIERVPITAIKQNPNNPRIIKDDKFEKLVASIKAFPQMLAIRPIVVNDDMVVLGGNMRLKACKAAQIEEVPIIRASKLTPEQQKEFIIKDNVGFGEWDMQMLRAEWDQTQLTEWGVDLPEFTDERVQAQEDDFEMPDEIQTDIKPGDLFQIGDHRLLCGDSTNSMHVDTLMNGETADMVMTDPPYNVNYEGGNGKTIMNDSMDDNTFYDFLAAFYKAFADVTKPGGAWYVWHHDSQGYNFRRAFQESGLLMKQCIIWVKNSFVMGRQDYQWKHEPCLYGWKEGAAHYFIDDRKQSTVIEDQIDVYKLKKEELQAMLAEMLSERTKTTVLHHDKPLRNAEHPTMKQILLIAPLIENSSKRGWIVADPFLGSGSTMVASHQLKRRCFGMELDPKYCQVIVDLMRALDPELTITRNGQPYNGITGK